MMICHWLCYDRSSLLLLLPLSVTLVAIFFFRQLFCGFLRRLIRVVERFQSFFSQRTMRPMDQNDNPQNSTSKPDNSNHSSPVPSPPPQPTPSSSSSVIPNIHVNSILRLTMIYDLTRTGKVVAYDPSLNLVTLRKFTSDLLFEIKLNFIDL